MNENTAIKLDDTTEVGAETRPLEVITEEIQFYKSQAGAACLEIGKRLAEAKTQLQHGRWLDWLHDEVEFSERAAQNFIRLAAEYRNPQPVADLGSTKALILLALPAAEREDFISELHLVDGQEKSVSDMSKRELERVVKELEAERTKVLFLEEQLELKLGDDGAADSVEIENANAAREAAEKKRAAAEDMLEQLRAEMQALKENPLVTAPTDDQLEQLRQDAEKQARKDAEAKLEKQIAKAKEDKAKAEQQLAVQKTAHEQVAAAMARENEQLAEKAAKLQKKLAVTSSADIAIFKVYFDDAQSTANKMLECIKRLADAGDVENKSKLTAALRAHFARVEESLAGLEEV